jgi:two-component system, OmpR family, alkaline phosphatase synthesis response regulator PhoP
MLKILVVDDEPSVRQMLEETLVELEEKGVQVLVAGNGMEALEAIRQQRPDLVFLDVLMPKMNGLEVCEVVKRQLGMTDVHIVMLTTKGQDVENQRAREVGADASMMKPLDPDAVYENALRALGLEESQS